MRQGQQHRRGRGRNNNGGGSGNHNHNHNNNRKGQNPLTRSFESNGPDVKVRGTPAHVAEKYMQLARDAQSSGDHVLAENYLQHAEHYNRIILVYREQQMQQSGESPNGGAREQHHRSDPNGNDGGNFDDAGDRNADPDGAPPAVSRFDSVEQPRGADPQPVIENVRPARDQERPSRFRDRPHRSRRSPDGFNRPERSADRQGGPSPEPRESRRPFQDERPAPAADSEDAPAASRPDADSGPRRRERFGLGADQPDFLRRPVRRPRRDSDGDAPADAPAAPLPGETPSE